MHPIFRSLALVLLIGPSLGSCAPFWKPLEILTLHENPAISTPAEVGAFAFGAVGLPVALVALPVTIPLGMDQDHSMMPMAPVFAFAQAGAILFGGLPYLSIEDF